jgi:hypothetical protein
MPTREQSISGQQARIQKMIDRGELVPNDPYKERMLWLLEHQEDFDVSTVCYRLHDKGLNKYVRSNGSNRVHADTSFLERQLGLRRRQATRKKNKQGQVVFYEGTFTTHIQKDIADALYEALEMDPLVEQGLMPELFPRRERRLSSTCRWGAGCDQDNGHGQFGRFCATHAKELQKLALSTNGFKRRGKKLRSFTKRGGELKQGWAEEILEQVA